MKFFRKSKGFTLVEIMIVVAIIGILIAIAVPGFIRARSQSRMKSCQENLTKIDGATEQWALENNKKPTDSVGQADLDNGGDGTGYVKLWPVEPSGYDYATTVVGAPPTCSSGLDGHALDAVGTVITTVE